MRMPYFHCVFDSQERLRHRSVISQGILQLIVRLHLDQRSEISKDDLNQDCPSHSRDRGREQLVEDDFPFAMSPGDRDLRPLL